MKRLFLILIFFCQSSLFSQNNISFEAILVNINNNEPIPFATISLKKSFLAITSNSEGVFKLAISEKALPDTLIIQHLSFKTSKFYVDKNNISTIKNIELKEKNVELSTTTIYGLSAKNVIFKTIENLDKNYSTFNFYLKGFYRQAHQENNKFVRLIECNASIKNKAIARQSNEQKIFFNIGDIRRSNVYERNGDKHGDHLLDLFSENPINYSQTSFLNRSNIHNYTFTFVDSESFSKFKILFQNKKWSSSENKHGYIIINKEDFAILEMEIISTDNFSKKTQNESKWRFQNGTFHIVFEKKDHYYFCSKISKYYNHFVLNLNTQNIEYIVEEYFDWFTESVSFDARNVKYKAFSNIYSKEYFYNKELWQKKELPSINTKIINDLNSFKDLELQFIDD